MTKGIYAGDKAILWKHKNNNLSVLNRTKHNWNSVLKKYTQFVFIWFKI